MNRFYEWDNKRQEIMLVRPALTLEELDELVKMFGTKTAEPATTDEISINFELFWKTYPNYCGRKVAKKQCFEKYKRIIKSGIATAKEIQNAVEIYKRVCDRPEKQNYTAMPQTWLNQQRWQAEYKQSDIISKIPL